MNIEEKDLPSAIRATGDRLFHFHCSENDRGIAGTGHVDWPGVLGALREVSYDRWLVLESFVSAIKEIAAAAAIWRDLAPSGDVLAEQGLKFLRESLATAP